MSSKDLRFVRLEQYGDWLLEPHEAAQFLGKVVGTLANDRSAGIGCAYIKNGKKVGYLAMDIAEHIASRRVELNNVQPC